MTNKTLQIAIIASLLSACGGGSSGSSNDTPETPDNTVPGGTMPQTPDGEAQPPVVLTDDSFTLHEHSENNVLMIFSNDEISIDLRPSVSFTQPAHGLVAQSEDNSYLLYTPGSDFYGNDEFNYQIESNGQTHSATVQLNILPYSPLIATIDYPNTTRPRNHGGTLAIQSRGRITSPNGYNIEADDIVSFSANGNAVDLSLLNINEWQSNLTFETSTTPNIKVTLNSVGDETSEAEGHFINNPLLANHHKMAIGELNELFLLDPVQGNIIRSSLNEENNWINTTLIQSHVSDNSDFDIRDISYDGATQRLIMATDGDSKAQIRELDINTGEHTLLYEDPEHNLYTAIQWLTDKRFIAIATDAANGVNAELLFVDFSDPDNHYRVEFSSFENDRRDDIAYFNNRIYVSSYDTPLIYSVTIPEAGDSHWQGFVRVSGSYLNQTKGSGPLVSNPHSIAVGNSGYLYAVNTQLGLVRIELISGHRVVSPIDFNYSQGVVFDHHNSFVLVSDTGLKQIKRTHYNALSNDIALLSNQTGSGAPLTNSISGITRYNDDFLLVADDDRILWVSLIDNTRAELPLSFESHVFLTDLEFDAATNVLYATDYGTRKIFAVDLSDLQNPVLSVVTSGDRLSKPYDMTFIDVDGNSHLLVADQGHGNEDIVILVNIETGAQSAITLSDNDHAFRQISLIGDHLYAVQFDSDRLLRYRRQEALTFGEKEEFVLPAFDPFASIMRVTEDETFAYVSDAGTGNRIYKIDLVNNTSTTLTQPIGSPVITGRDIGGLLIENYQDPVSGVTFQNLLVTDKKLHALLEVDVVSGQASVISQGSLAISNQI